MNTKNLIKQFFSKLPFSAEVYRLFARGRRRDRYSLEQLSRNIENANTVAKYFRADAPRGKKVLMFATMHYWIEQAAMLGLALAGQGHDVTLLTLPYSDWRKSVDEFDLKQRKLYTREVLANAPLIHHASLLDVHPAQMSTPLALENIIQQISLYDAQYTLQAEDVDADDETYRLRLERNRFAAQTLLHWMQINRPEVVVIPNGLILELAIAYQIARMLDIPAMTYEFNDQKEQIWLAQNDEIMRQNTDVLWRARGTTPLNAEQLDRMEQFESARRGARLEGKSARLWQGAASQGGEQVRAELGLDQRPIVLLATNVLGDSLTLGRQKFSRNMAEWIEKTVQFFAQRNDVQLVIRVHPGEALTHGPSMVGVVENAVKPLPGHIHLIPAAQKLNTYDLIDIASLGLVYTTTTGLEMSLAGVPVIVSGQTHYAQRGFTLDPNTWDEYYSTLKTALADLEGRRLNKAQTELAWRYAYNFFFEFARPFPWRLMNMWDDLRTWPLERVLGNEGREFGATLRALVGEPIVW
jgi:hypothetical protein